MSDTPLSDCRSNVEIQEPAQQSLTAWCSGPRGKSGRNNGDGGSLVPRLATNNRDLRGLPHKEIIRAEFVIKLCVPGLS